MKYFANFPKVKDTINGFQYELLDLSYAPASDFEDYETMQSALPPVNEVGLLSLNLYEDPNNFWAILFANDVINPWMFLKETPSQFNQRNKDFYGFFAKYASSNKLNPNAHVVFQREDIIVRGDYGNTGFTAASSIFTDYDTLNDDDYNLDTWFVQNAFSDTKKAKVTKNLNAGNTGTPIIGEGENILILRKGNTGYYILNNPFSTSSKNITTLTNYKYAQSPVYFNEIGKSDVILSPSDYISATDTLITVMANNAPDAPGIAAYGDYTPIVTKTFYEYEYFTNNNFNYLNPASFSQILGRLI
jgi:hypothetical protein